METPVCTVRLGPGNVVSWSNISRRHVCLELKAGRGGIENWKNGRFSINLAPLCKQLQGSSRSYREVARPKNHFVKRWQFGVSDGTLVEATKDFRHNSGGFGGSVAKQLTKLDTLYVEQLETTHDISIRLLALLGVLNVFSCTESALAGETGASNAVYGDVGVVLEVGVQLLYLGALLTLLGVGSFLVVRQVLIKRELETAAKDLQDRVRTGDASSLDYFELGAVMLRKKFYQLARKYLNEAIKKWDGSEQDLAQVYNALGFSYFSDGKTDLAIGQYEKAVKLQPMYVTAWNNLADAYESQRKYEKALKAYEEALQFDPSNKIASAKRQQMKQRVEKFQGIP